MNATTHLYEPLLSARLPNPFIHDDGAMVADIQDWERRRQEIAQQMLALEYGGLPRKPAVTVGEVLNESRIRWLPGARYITLRVVTENGAGPSFILYLTIPEGEGPFPVVVNGDGCWRYVTEEVTRMVLSRQYILAEFNRTEIAPDMAAGGRGAPIYRWDSEGTFGALAAWAWGYHRVVDVLSRRPDVAADKIAITGHSRGGKTSLLAGATDDRIALTNANDSGCGGAGSFRCPHEGAERLENILKSFPHWFGPELAAYIGRDHELPFDQHFLKALVAPRAYLSTEALGDLWANPKGTMQTHLAAREVYAFLGASDQIGISYREGGHAYTAQDWGTLLDFMDWRFYGKPTTRSFTHNPFEDDGRAFDWKAPV